MSAKEKTDISPLEKIRHYMRENGIDRLLSDNPKVGIALSGGPDSMAMLHLAVELGWHTVALHCNFGLRGEESERDEDFVTRHCMDAGIELHKVCFDVWKRMRDTGESTEMACRELRYAWFREIASEKGLQAIALGHHMNDNIETFMLNALRGCGTGGGKGIPPTRDIFIRPLLCLSRREILHYLEEKGIPSVTDSTNAANDFSRNKLRNIILPAIEECFPGGGRRLDMTSRNIARDNRLLQSLVNEKRARYTCPDGSIAARLLFETEREGATLLYHILSGDLDLETIIKIQRSIQSSGKFHTGRSGQRYLLDRGMLIPLRDKSSATDLHLTIDRDELKATGETALLIPGTDMRLNARLLTRQEFAPRRDASFAWFDAAILSQGGELTIRHTRTGDRIKPFGMKGSRLLSDIFTDCKLSVTDKERQTVVCLGEEIIWIPGIKNSRLHTVGSEVENILELHMLNVAKKS